MSRDLFLEAVRLMPWTTEVLQIPFEHVWLPGYFMRPAPPMLDHVRRSLC